MSTKELKAAFPGLNSNARSVKNWLRRALRFRDVADSDMGWVDNCVWIGYDLYHLRQEDIALGLSDFKAPDEVARVLSRDSGKAIAAKYCSVLKQVARFVIVAVVVIAIFVFATEGAGISVGLFASALFIAAASWFWPGKMTMGKSFMAIIQYSEVLPYTPIKIKHSKKKSSAGLPPGTKTKITTSFYEPLLRSTGYEHEEPILRRTGQRQDGW